jgi:ADP-ribose pyrophosphatase YjhB (NUDIX family)
METTLNQKIKLVADAALFCNDKVLMVTYKDTSKYDDEKGWFLPDDYIQFSEHPEDAAKRILNEQLGFITGNLKLDHMESFVGNDKSWHLIFHYYLQMDSMPKMLPSGNIKSWEWFDFYKLPDEKDIAPRMGEIYH